MSRAGGLRSITSAYARFVQKNQWAVIKQLRPDLPDPGWDKLSINRAWKHLEEVCEKEGIDYNYVQENCRKL